MFTGIVTHQGEITRIDAQDGLKRFSTLSDLPFTAIEIGASIAHSGVCLTVIDVSQNIAGRTVVVTEAIGETLGKTTLDNWVPGQIINLEMSLKYGDEVGGHLVSGHVDGLAEIISITEQGGGHILRLNAPDSLHKFVAEKGSVALDGVSLTVSKRLENNDFEVSIIPHTWQFTSLGVTQPGSKLNFEVDMLARYVDRMLHPL